MTLFSREEGREGNRQYDQENLDEKDNESDREVAGDGTG
jgi:hypothetical protein